MEKFEKYFYVGKILLYAVKAFFYLAITVCICKATNHYCSNANTSTSREILEEELLEKQIESFELELSQSNEK